MPNNTASDLLSTLYDEVDTFTSARTDDVWDVYYNQNNEVNRYGHVKSSKEVVDKPTS